MVNYPDCYPPMQEQPISISFAQTTDDANALLGLIDQLAEFEHLAPPDEDARHRFLHDGFERKPPRFEALLATMAGEESPCAYAIVFETYSSFLCRPTLFLEDLFVLPEYRRRGVGDAILRRLTQEAEHRDCGRMEWTCLDWNVNAQRFYDKAGARHLSEWYLYRLDRDSIARFAGGSSAESK